MNRIGRISFLFALLLGGCGQFSSWPIVPGEVIPPTFGARDSTFSDAQVRAAVYSRAYHGPAGFYHESNATMPYYVNTVSIAPWCCQPNEWRELATEDIDQAQAWADSTLAHSSGRSPVSHGPPVVTERYIEFFADGQGMRAHRSSYLVPNAFLFAFFSADSEVGTFNARPIDADHVRGLAEYLWFKWNDHMGGAEVLSSYGEDSGEDQMHVIYEVQTTYGDFDMTDDLMLSRLEYRVAKSTGEVVLRKILQRHVNGHAH